MQDQPEFHAVGGQLHRVIYEEIDQDTAEAEVQAELDQAQNEFNAAMQVREQAELTYTAAETAAEQASKELDAAKLVEEDKESVLQKSLAGRDSLARAKQLAAEQLEREDAEEDDAGADEEDEDEPIESEAQPVPVHTA